MKNRTTRSEYGKDERAITSQGRISKSRVVVLEALEAQGKEGATIDELAQLIGQDVPGDNPKMSIGSVLSRMESDGYVCVIRNRWFLTEHAPQSENRAPSSNGHRVQIAPMVQKRSGKTISIYRTPVVYNEAIAVSMLIAQRWYKVPFFGSLRICIGLEAPNWSPEQEMYTDVEVLKITHKNGQTSEERPAPKDIVTIAAEE